jgi:hypothetical protein
MYAIFNSENKFISYSDQKMEHPFLCVEIPPEKSDILKWRWDGDFYNGKMVRIDDSPYPDILNQKSFQEKYPFDFLISMILKQLFITSKQNKTCEKSFEKMVKEYILSFESENTFLNLLKIVDKN